MLNGNYIVLIDTPKGERIQLNVTFDGLGGITKMMQGNYEAPVVREREANLYWTMSLGRVAGGELRLPLVALSESAHFDFDSPDGFKTLYLVGRSDSRFHGIAHKIG